MIPLPSMAAGDSGVAAAPIVPPITFVNGNSQSGSGGSISLAQPSGIAADDFGIVTSRCSGGAVSTPSAWTQLVTNIFTRKYPAGAGSIFLTGSTGDYVAAVQVFRNVHPSAPIDVSSTPTAVSSGTSFASSAITALHNNSILIVTTRIAVASGSPTITPPDGFTATVRQLNTGFTGIAYKAGFNAGDSSGTPAWASTIATNSATTMYIFLRQAGT